MSGLLVAGLFVDIPGLTILSPGEESWCRIDARDGKPREADWIRQITPHTTKGIWPQIIRPGSPPNPGTRAEQVARWWSTSKERGSAHVVVDGRFVACLADVVKFEAFHATKANPHSIGIEMVQEADGTVYEDTLDSTVKIVLTLCDLLGIPLQVSSVPYKRNTIIERLRYGGPDVVGVFGHNESAWRFPEWLPPEKRARWPQGYADRGQGDPGDEIKRRLIRAGAAAFDFDRKEEIAYWRKVQRYLNQSHQAGLDEDGVCGPGTVAALRRAGLWNGGVFLEAPTP